MEIFQNGNLVTTDGHTCLICGADWDQGQWSAGCPSCEDCNYIRNPHPDTDEFMDALRRLT